MLLKQLLSSSQVYSAYSSFLFFIYACIFFLLLVNIVAMQEQRTALAAAGDSTAGESSLAEGTLPKDKKKEIFEPLDFKIERIPVEEGGSGMNPPLIHTEFHIEDGVEAAANVEEHQFITNFIDQSPMHKRESRDIKNNPESKNLSALRNGSDEDLCFSLQLGDREPKRLRSSSSITIEEPK